MTIFSSSNWYNGNDTGWASTILQGGPILAENGAKNMYGSGVFINNLGFFRSSSIQTQTDLIFQIDFKASSAIAGVISLCGISLNSFLSSSNSASILFNTFLDTPGFTGNIRFNDYGENEVSGGSAISTLQIGPTYTAKIKINSNGTASAYINAPQIGVVNQLLGTTSIATNLNNAPVYFQCQQTFIGPSSTASTWDNWFVHNEGLNFQVPFRQDCNLDSHDYALKEKYAS